MQIVAVLIQQLLQRCALHFRKSVLVRSLVSSQCIDLHMKDTGFIHDRNPLGIGVHIFVYLRQNRFFLIVDFDYIKAVFFGCFNCKHS